MVICYYTVYKIDGHSYCEIQIKDTGYGIKEKDKKKLFKLFGFVETTQDTNTRGIGLGLAISKKIVNEFNGNIGFVSEEEKGSTFSFRLQLESDWNEISKSKEG